jgi:hypothetical protein
LARLGRTTRAIMSRSAASLTRYSVVPTTMSRTVIPSRLRIVKPGRWAPVRRLARTRGRRTRRRRRGAGVAGGAQDRLGAGHAHDGGQFDRRDGASDPCPPAGLRCRAADPGRTVRAGCAAPVRCERKRRCVRDGSRAARRCGIERVAGRARPDRFTRCPGRCSPREEVEHEARAAPVGHH